MIEFLVAFILILGISMSGFRRVKLLNSGFALQSLAIALVCFIKGYQSNEYHYYVLFILTLLTKVILIPQVIRRSMKDVKLIKETELIISSNLSYLISGLSVILSFVFLKNFPDFIFKAGCILIMVGGILLIGRKKAISQMIGLLTMENGIVLFEISMVKMGSIIELGIVFEVLVLSLIMGIMIFRINKTFNTINTDYLSNLKE